MAERAGAVAGVANDAPRSGQKALGVFVLTVFLGPPIGALAVVGPFALFSGNPWQSLSGFASAISGIAIVGYAAGLTRAVFVGLWVAFLIWRNGSVGYGQCVFAALGVTLLGTLYAFAAVGIDHPIAIPSVNAILGLASVVAILVCRWIAGRLGFAAH